MKLLFKILFVQLFLLASCESEQPEQQQQPQDDPRDLGMYSELVSMTNSLDKSVGLRTLNESTSRCVEQTSSGCLQLNFNGDSCYDLDFGTSDLSGYKSIKFSLAYPGLSMANYEATESMSVTIVDENGTSHCEQYPFTNIPWIFDKREIAQVPGVPGGDWHINLKDFSSQGVNLAKVDEVSIRMAGGSGEIIFGDITLNNPEFIMDVSRAIIKTSFYNYSDCRNKSSMSFGRPYWGSCIIKVDGVYHRYTAYWNSETTNEAYTKYGGRNESSYAYHWWEGAIDYHTSTALMPACSWTFHEDKAISRPPLDESKPWETWGFYAHNPEIFRDDDGTYYMYYLSNCSEPYLENGEDRNIALAYSSSPSGPWTYVEEPLLNKGEHGAIDPDLKSASPTVAPRTTGLGNPRMVKKDGVYYLFYKVLARYTYDHPKTNNPNAFKHGGTAWLLYYTCATADNPKGPFTKQTLTGLKGLSTNYDLYIDCGMTSPGNMDVEDACFYEYRGKYFCIMKDFRGYWNRTAVPDAPTLWESDDLLNWRVSDFPLITDAPGVVNFADKTDYYNPMERAFLFLDDDGETGVMTYAMYPNMLLPFDFKLMY